MTIEPRKFLIKECLGEDNSGNTQRIIACGIFKKILIKNIGQKRDKSKIILKSWEKKEPIGLKGANNKALNP